MTRHIVLKAINGINVIVSYEELYSALAESEATIYGLSLKEIRELRYLLDKEGYKCRDTL